MMRKYILLTLFALILPLGSMAQSSMSDEQVMRFVLKERNAGTSQSQIVTKLMQKGVDINQIRRVRKKAERLQKDQGLGTVSMGEKGDSKTDDRTRKVNKKKDNTKTEEVESVTNYRIEDTEKSKTKNTFDENDEDYMDMLDEMDSWMPVDTATMYKRLLEKIEKKKKKVFGRDIFNNKELSFEPGMNIATPQNYILGAGDAVYIDIYGASQKTIESTVSPDGTVTIEGFGPVYVAGMTVAQANARLRAQLGARYSSSNIKLTVGQTRSITVNVYGEVKTPGTYTLSAFSTPLNALYLAGGINDLGTLRNIKVHRQGKLIAVVDVYDIILNGKSGNIRLADNDVIYVGAYDCLVNITGKVKRPMIYEMKRSESVGTLLKYAGGFTGDAYTKSVRLIRKTGKQFSIYNIDEFDMSSFHLSDEDSVSVDSVLSRFENMVKIKGAVFRPGMYQVGGRINSVRTLIESAEGLKEEAFVNRAVMHRMRPDRTLEVIPIDVEGILEGRVADLALQANDELFIPTKSEMMEEQTLTVHGEVMYPGIYKYAANSTLEDIILQAGGLKETASMVKVDVARRIVNPKAVTNDSIIAKTFSFSLKDGFVIDGEPGFILQPFDEVYIRKSPGTYKQQNVTVEGEVMFAGVYTLPKKEPRLSDLIKAAGGINDLAYAAGARLERKPNESERLRMEAVWKKELEQYETNMMEMAMKSGNVSAIAQMQAKDENKEGSQQLKKYQIPESFPVAIELEKALANPGGKEDLILREDDRIIVPRYNATVKVNGEVMYPNTLAYSEGKSVGYYINQAGGFSPAARKGNTYIIYMNGKVAKVGQNAKPGPGSEIVVPAKSVNKSSLAERLSIVTGIGSLAAIIATIANLLK